MAKELLFSVTKKDFDINYFSGTGCGGQARNKHQNCCRMTHRDSGASAVGQTQRDRLANEQAAFRTIVNSIKFKMWHQRKVTELLEHKTLDQHVDELMCDKNLKVETLKDGKWEPFVPSVDEV